VDPVDEIVAPALLDALRIQGDATTTSPLYVHLLRIVLEDAQRGGPSASVLARADPSLDPWAHALPLRFLGALHRIVLEGRCDELARHYPSAGGSFDPAAPRPGIAGDLLTAIAKHRDELIAGLDKPVQTNEPARSAALVGGYLEIARRTRTPLRVLEIGSSAGLNLRWDRFHYDTGETSFGDPSSAVRFDRVWEGSLPDLDVAVTVAARRGCDAAPVDPSSRDGALTLQSFVWPDQLDRMARLRAAIDVADAVPATVDRASADEWVEQRLTAGGDGLATVVVHSIVLQYLGREVRHRVRDAIRAAGTRAGGDTSVHWLRMEPAGEVADVRLTSWRGGTGDGVDEVVATCGYHGTPVWWRSGDVDGVRVE
jgi:hypothetical protein